MMLRALSQCRLFAAPCAKLPQESITGSLHEPYPRAEPLVRPPQVKRPLRPQDVVEGGQVEYYSDSHRCWMPCTVVYLDVETGGVKLDIKPNQILDLVEQQLRLRPRTRPQRAQLEWVRSVLREGRLEEEAQALFNHHAQGHQSVADLNSLGAELDATLGISGCVCFLKRAVDEQRDGCLLSFEAFGEVFWELLWHVQRDFGQALLQERSKQRCQQTLQEAYSLERVLGKGSFGVVKLARCRASGAERAVKLLSKQEHLWGSAEQVEIEHLCLLDHPHIVRLYEHYEDNSCIYLVMDFCSGGELLHTIRQSQLAKRNIPEDFVAHVMRQVLLAIAHVHARGIVHLDLKSTNIMLMPSRSTLPPGRPTEGYALVDVDDRPHAMIIDLGVAQIFRPGNFRFNRPIGTPATMAPEVWKGEIHPKADVFSCGVVLFELLSLSLPFACSADHVKAILYWSAVPPPSAPWAKLQGVSDYARGLCCRMLVLDRRGRPTASQSLQAPFLQEPGSAVCQEAGTPPALSSQQQRLLRQLAAAPQRSVLQRSVAMSIARAWPANQLPSIKRLFHDLDAAQSGRPATEQLELALQRLGLESTCAREAVAAIDLSRDGTVTWSEFVAACVDFDSGLYERDLRRTFDRVDADGDGLLSQEDICRLLAADHLEDDSVRDIFADLVGRIDPGARMDWPTFRRHFCSVPADDQAQQAVTPNSSKGEFLEQARSFFEAVRNVLWPGPEPELGVAQEETLRRLAQMGFTDTDRCIAVLLKHNNRLSDLVIAALLEGDTAA